MGYDCHVVDENGKYVEGDHCYWRRNIFGMGAQADRLVAAGIAYWPRESFQVPGPWLKYEDYGIEYNAEWSGEDDDPNDPQFLGDPEKIAEYELAHAKYLKETYDERPGIAAYKLCHSNDGWWVTKAECESALKLWEANKEPKLDEYGDTIPFLRAAAQHHGFQVW